MASSQNNPDDYHPRHVLDDEGFRESAREVIKDFFGGDENAFNDYIRITGWALHEDAESTGKLVEGSRVLRLVDVQGVGGPRLQVYFVIEGDICWRRWVQVDPDWRG